MVDDAAFFSRQQGLRELDLDRLHACSVLVVGIGNVGGPAALEIARAGVGQLTLVDRGTVEPANLSRGIFGTADLGTPKARAAASTIASSVAGVDVSALVADVRVEVPEPFFSSFDAVVTATDSWPSRWFANRWSHALPGKVKIVVTGGLSGLSWDVVSSVPGGACAQCPHGNDVPKTDEGGGCGIIGGARPERVDPSVSFTGGAVAAYLALEVCATLGGSGPRFAGSMLSFEYETGAHRLLRLVPGPDCEGHRRLVDGRDYVTVADEGVTIGELVDRVARVLGVHPDAVSLAAELEILRSRTCMNCGARDEIMLPLVIGGVQASTPCGACGALTFDIDARLALEGPGRTLAELGVRPGKAVIAYVGGTRIYVIRRWKGA